VRLESLGKLKKSNDVEKYFTTIVELSIKPFEHTGTEKYINVKQAV
jgi:hypothetical protein